MTPESAKNRPISSTKRISGLNLAEGEYGVKVVFGRHSKYISFLTKKLFLYGADTPVCDSGAGSGRQECLPHKVKDAEPTPDTAEFRQYR